MAVAVAAVQELEVALAQRLASNDKTVRSRALKTLRKYISLRSHKTEGGFTAEDLLKIWKGLFYCLWMQDKPLLQGELSEKISSLIHSFHSSSSQLLFLETFLQTMKREWNGIDRLRMDKFLQLVRFVFRQAFEVLRRKEWDLSFINQFLEVVSVQLFQTTGSVPNGLVLHVLELYLTELGHIGAAELTADQNLEFLGPFFKTLSRTKSRWLLSSVCKNIFRVIVDQAAFAIEDLMTELQDNPEEEEEEEEEEESPQNTRKTKRGRAANGFSEGKGSSAEEDEDEDEDEAGLEKPGSGQKEMGSVLQFDYSAVAERLFQVGGHTNTPNINRTKIYNLVKIFRNLSEGVFPDDGEVSSESSDEDELITFLKMDKEKKKRTRETEEITAKRKTSPEEPRRAKKKKKKKSKQLKSVEQEVDADPDSHTETEQGPPETEPQEPETPTPGGSNKTKKKTKKRKSSFEPESNGTADDVITVEPSGKKKNKKSRRASQDRCATDGDAPEQPSNGVEDGNQENVAQPEICTENHAEPKPKKKKKKKRTGVLMTPPPEGGDEQTAPTAPTPNPTVEVMSDPQSEDATPKRKSKKKSKASAEVASSGTEPEVCPPPPQDGGKKKRKVSKVEADAPLSNGVTEAGSGKKPKMSVRPNNKTKTGDKSGPSQFISFQGLAKPPTALFCKTKGRDAPCTPPSSGIKKCLTPKSETKKVTFGLKNNKTAEFKKTDRSLLVSPVGPSRIAFDPKKRPVSGVLKSPPGFSAVGVKKATPKKRATAADFF